MSGITPHDMDCTICSSEINTNLCRDGWRRVGEGRSSQWPALTSNGCYQCWRGLIVRLWRLSVDNGAMSALKYSWPLIPSYSMLAKSVPGQSQGEKVKNLLKRSKLQYDVFVTGRWFARDKVAHLWSGDVLIPLQYVSWCCQLLVLCHVGRIKSGAFTVNLKIKWLHQGAAHILCF